MLSHHVIDYRPDGYTIAHPLRCRTRSLFECPVTEAEVLAPPDTLGRYLCRVEYGEVVNLARFEGDPDQLGAWAVWSDDLLLTRDGQPRLEGIALSEQAAGQLADDAMERLTELHQLRGWIPFEVGRPVQHRFKDRGHRFRVWATRPKVVA